MNSVLASALDDAKAGNHRLILHIQHECKRIPYFQSDWYRQHIDAALPLACHAFQDP